VKYIINAAGNRIVVATPQETRSLRPSIRACFRGWRANDDDIEDFCQEVEIITWKCVQDQRIQGDHFARPVDALLDFMLSVAWNVWRNHSRKRYPRCEVLHEEMPDVAGADPEGRIDARETLLRLTMREDIARILLDVVNVPFAARHRDLPRTTYCKRLVNARKWARDVDAGHWRGPKQPFPPKLKHRKKKR
jgi:hypothetical protein